MIVPPELLSGSDEAFLGRYIGRLKDLHRISEQITQEFIALCDDRDHLEEAGVLLEIHTLKDRLQRLLIRQVAIKHKVELKLAMPHASMPEALDAYPDTSLWLVLLGLEQYTDLLISNNVTCDVLLRLSDEELPILLKSHLKVTEKDATNMIGSLQSIKSFVPDDEEFSNHNSYMWEANSSNANNGRSQQNGVGKSGSLAGAAGGGRVSGMNGIYGAIPSNTNTPTLSMDSRQDSHESNSTVKQYRAGNGSNNSTTVVLLDRSTSQHSRQSSNSIALSPGGRNSNFLPYVNQYGGHGAPTSNQASTNSRQMNFNAVSQIHGGGVGMESGGVEYSQRSGRRGSMSGRIERGSVGYGYTGEKGLSSFYTGDDGGGLIGQRPFLQTQANAHHSYTNIGTSLQAVHRQHSQTQTQAPEVVQENNAVVPTTTQRRISHRIPHRFSQRHYSATVCTYCLGIVLFGKKCKYCDCVCHSKCKDFAPPTCGLPPAYEEYFKSLITVTLGSDSNSVQDEIPGVRPGLRGDAPQRYAVRHKERVRNPSQQPSRNHYAHTNTDQSQTRLSPAYQHQTVNVSKRDDSLQAQTQVDTHPQQRVVRSGGRTSEYGERKAHTPNSKTRSLSMRSYNEGTNKVTDVTDETTGLQIVRMGSTPGKPKDDVDDVKFVHTPDFLKNNEDMHVTRRTSLESKESNSSIGNRFTPAGIHTPTSTTVKWHPQNESASGNANSSIKLKGVLTRNQAMEMKRASSMTNLGTFALPTVFPSNPSVGVVRGKSYKSSAVGEDKNEHRPPALQLKTPLEAGRRGHTVQTRRRGHTTSSRPPSSPLRYEEERERSKRSHHSHGTSYGLSNGNNVDGGSNSGRAPFSPAMDAGSSGNSLQHSHVVQKRVQSPMLRQTSVNSGESGGFSSPKSRSRNRASEGVGGSPASGNRKRSNSTREKSDMADWEIPYSEIVFMRKITDGPGEVHRARWHGDVAVKVWDIENISDRIIKAFRREVGMLRKLRHQNILLFMGACIAPPKLAIVTKFCHGYTLFYHIHVAKTTFRIEDVVDIVTQFSQGMEYLHARQVLKRTLTSRNVYVETDGKVMIGGFTLSTLAKESEHGDHIPGGRIRKPTVKGGKSPHVSPRGTYLRHSAADSFSTLTQAGNVLESSSSQISTDQNNNMYTLQKPFRSVSQPNGQEESPTHSTHSQYQKRRSNSSQFKELTTSPDSDIFTPVLGADADVGSGDGHINTGDVHVASRNDESSTGIVASLQDINITGISNSTSTSTVRKSASGNSVHTHTRLNASANNDHTGGHGEISDEQLSTTIAKPATVPRSISTLSRSKTSIDTTEGGLIAWSGTKDTLLSRRLSGARQFGTGAGSGGESVVLSDRQSPSNNVATHTPVMSVKIQAASPDGNRGSEKDTEDEDVVPVGHIFDLPTNVTDLKYLAPEILRNPSTHMFTVKSDVYSFGIVVFELLTMANPWPDVDARELIDGVVQRTLTLDFSRLRDETPIQLLSVLNKCVAFEPDERLPFDKIQKTLAEITARKVQLPEDHSRAVSAVTNGDKLLRSPSLPAGSTGTIM
eukprot:CFRG7644T1